MKLFDEIFINIGQGIRIRVLAFINYKALLFSSLKTRLK
jgi:hypothetical protein